MIVATTQWEQIYVKKQRTCHGTPEFLSKTYLSQDKFYLNTNPKSPDKNLKVYPSQTLKGK